MSYEDPFNSAPADDQAVAEPANVKVIKSAKVAEGDGKIVMTFKEAAGFDASWTVVHAASVQDAKAVLLDPEFKELLELQKSAAAFYRGGNVKKPAGGGGAPAGTPQQAQEAPGGEKRFCSHGEMVFRSGISKAGKAYKLFSCTAPRQEQCAAQFL